MEGLELCFLLDLKTIIMWNHFSIPKANYLNTQTFKKQIKWQTQLEISISLSPIYLSNTDSGYIYIFMPNIYIYFKSNFLIFFILVIHILTNNFKSKYHLLYNIWPVLDSIKRVVAWWRCANPSACGKRASRVEETVNRGKRSVKQVRISRDFMFIFMRTCGWSFLLVDLFIF